jgi:hypothetical protein
VCMLKSWPGERESVCKRVWVCVEEKKKEKLKSWPGERESVCKRVWVCVLGKIVHVGKKYSIPWGLRSPPVTGDPVWVCNDRRQGQRMRLRPGRAMS